MKLLVLIKSQYVKEWTYQMDFKPKYKYQPQHSFLLTHKEWSLITEQQ